MKRTPTVIARCQTGRPGIPEQTVPCSVKQRDDSLTVPSIDTVRPRKPVVAVSIQGTHIVYHRGQHLLSDQGGKRSAPARSAVASELQSSRRWYCLASATCALLVDFDDVANLHAWRREHIPVGKCPGYTDRMGMVHARSVWWGAGISRHRIFILRPGRCSSAREVNLDRVTIHHFTNGFRVVGANHPSPIKIGSAVNPITQFPATRRILVL